MKKNKTLFLSLFLIVFFIIFIFKSVGAQNDNSVSTKKSEIIFKARVVNVIDRVEKEASSGEKIIQQNLQLSALDGQFKGQNIIFYGIGDVEVIGAKEYSINEKVLVVANFNELENSYEYYIIDHVRGPGLLIISLSFLLLLIIIGRVKGLRSFLSLILTFLVIIFFIVPQIMAGANPIFIVLVGSIFILLFIIYLTEGINLRSHLAVLSTFISLILVVIISWLFVYLTKLTGAFSEDVFVLVSVGQQIINLKGMLLAGMIIGALGVLDDVIISQIVSVEQIIEANPFQNKREVFKRAYKIGISHISSMTNTLFLAYAGASLPLLILFVSPANPFSNIEQIFNNEAISTEIVRALSGSIGIILSVPISTFMATVFFINRKNKKH